MNVDAWKDCSLKGLPARIFREETHGPLRLLVCPNGISAVLVQPGSKVVFRETEAGKKVRKSAEFVVVDGESCSLPFDFVLKETAQDAEYVAIVLRQ